MQDHYENILWLLSVTLNFYFLQVGDSMSDVSAKDLPGLWVNELKSVMLIFELKNIQGDSWSFQVLYHTAVSSGGCAKGIFKGNGFYNSKSLEFGVSWTNSKSNCASVTAWSGNLTEPSKIITQWLVSFTSLGKPFTEPGKDTFHKLIGLPTVTAEELQAKSDEEREEMFKQAENWQELHDSKFRSPEPDEVLSHR